MAHEITDELIAQIAILAKLELSEEERQNACTDLARMLDYVDQIQKLDTDGVEPMSHIFSSINVFREDVLTNENGQETTLANAPLKTNSCFIVPKTF